MRRNLTLVLAGALAFGAVAAHGVDVDHPCYDEATDSVVYTEQDVFFHRGASPVATGASPWDTTAPSASVQSGAGSLAPSSSAAVADIGGAPRSEAVFAGTFDGCLDVVAVDLYSFDPTNRSGTSGTAEPATHDFGLKVVVDGQTLITVGPVEAKTTFANEGFGPNLNQFSFDIGSVMALYADAGADVQLDGEHTIEVHVAAWYANTGHAAYLWDTTEVPSGMTFNATDLTNYPTVG